MQLFVPYTSGNMYFTNCGVGKTTSAAFDSYDGHESCFTHSAYRGITLIYCLRPISICWLVRVNANGANGDFFSCVSSLTTTGRFSLQVFTNRSRCNAILRQQPRLKASRPKSSGLEDCVVLQSVITTTSKTSSGLNAHSLISSGSETTSTWSSRTLTLTPKISPKIDNSRCAVGDSIHAACRGLASITLRIRTTASKSTSLTSLRPEFIAALSSHSSIAHQTFTSIPARYAISRSSGKSLLDVPIRPHAFSFADNADFDVIRSLTSPGEVARRYSPLNFAVSSIQVCEQVPNASAAVSSRTLYFQCAGDVAKISPRLEPLTYSAHQESGSGYCSEEYCWCMPGKLQP
ncbi:exonuclease [Klebsiella phage vB_KshKPC-M]|nr:exonuclease [Klebsiella phage vB_KshKPC-M]